MANDLEEFTAYLSHLQAEHRRLQQSLRRIEGLWPGRENPRMGEAISQVVDEFVTLRAELAHHFEEEESGGCLEEAVSRHPSSSHEELRLEHEHPVLLEQLDRLIAKLERLSRPLRSVDEAQEDFRRFAEQLHAHEESEIRILEESLCLEDE